MSFLKEKQWFIGFSVFFLEGELSAKCSCGCFQQNIGDKKRHFMLALYYTDNKHLSAWNMIHRPPIAKANITYILYFSSMSLQKSSTDLLLFSYVLQVLRSMCWLSNTHMLFESTHFSMIRLICFKSGISFFVVMYESIRFGINAITELGCEI